VTTSLRLDPETEALLARLAARRRQTRSAVIRDSIALLAEREADERGTAYSRIAHLVGCFDSGGARLSEHTGRKVRALLAGKKRGRRPR
jgi:predicted ATPase